MAQHDVWFSYGADVGLIRPNLAVTTDPTTRGPPMAAVAAPLPVGGRAGGGPPRGAAQRGRPRLRPSPPPQVPFVRRISQLLETPVPLLSQFPERKGGHPYSRRFSATIAWFWAESNRTTGRRGTPFPLAFPPGIRILETLPEGAGTISRKRPHKEARRDV